MKWFQRLSELKKSDPFRYLRRLFIIVAGFTILICGVALIFLPGPAILVIPIGLAILATEFVWAKTVLSKMKKLLRRGGKEEANEKKI